MVAAHQGAGMNRTGDAAREDVLARVRAAIQDAITPAIPRTYRHGGPDPPGSPALLDLLTDRLVNYRASVHHCVAAQLPETVRAVLADVVPTGGRVIVPPGPPSDWVDGVSDHPGLRPADLDGFAAVVTGCAAAVADTGTIALDGSPDQGRRAITLIPDIHICVVRADQVVRSVGVEPTLYRTFHHVLTTPVAKSL